MLDHTQRRNERSDFRLFRSSRARLAGAGGAWGDATHLAARGGRLGEKNP